MQLCAALKAEFIQFSHLITEKLLTRHAPVGDVANKGFVRGTGAKHSNERILPLQSVVAPTRAQCDVVVTLLATQ
jgi:hypothetical protein